jgi:hypothetical protein
MKQRSYFLPLALSGTVLAAGGAFAQSANSPAALADAKLVVTATADLTSNQCGESLAVAAPAGTELLFCYTLTNIGTEALVTHDVVDDLGTVLENFEYLLAPTYPMAVTQVRVPAGGSPHVVTWISGTNTAGEETETSAAANLEISPALVSCNGPTSTFSNGIPVGWTSHDARALSLAPDSDVDWRDLAACGETSNYTGARGGAACASSAAVDPQPYDTQLRSHRFSLVGRDSAKLVFLLNYQDFASNDQLAIEIQEGDGEWADLSIATSSFGPFRSSPGVPVELDLTPWAGRDDLRIRYRYSNDSPSASDWYVQVDNIRLLCDGGVFFDGFESGDDHAWSADFGTTESAS